LYRGGGNAIDGFVAFLKLHQEPLILIATGIIVLFVVLVRRSGDLVARVFRGLFVGSAIGCVMHFVLHKDLTLVVIVGVVSFLLTAIFGRAD